MIFLSFFLSIFLLQAVLPEEVHQLPLRSRLVVEVLEGVPPPAELGVFLERPVKVRIPAVLACLALQGHQLSVHGPQDVGRALVHVPLRVGVCFLPR